MKRSLILLSKDPASIKDTIQDAFLDNNIIYTNNVTETKKIIEDNPDIQIVIIDVPSSIPDAQKLIDHITKQNTYVHSISVLLLISHETCAKDLTYLGGAAFDIAYKPLHPVILANRLKNAEQYAESLSFDEFTKMLKVLPANIYLKDANGRYVFSSQTWCHLDTKNDPNWTIRGKTDIEIRKDKENAIIAMQTDKKILKEKKGISYIIEESIEDKQFLQLIKEPLYYPDGRPRGIIALINDVTEQEKLKRELKERSIRDSLTGLYNRTYFNEYISKIINNDVFPLSIISADCNRLKQVNDKYGHLTGDTYICACAALMKDNLPENSCIFRMGGDEFTAFLPKTNESQSRQYIQMMKQRSNKYLIKNVNLSVSFGSSTMNSSNENIMEFIKLSDKNMYKDKNRR